MHFITLRYGTSSSKQLLLSKLFSMPLPEAKPTEAPHRFRLAAALSNFKHRLALTVPRAAVRKINLVSMLLDQTCQQQRIWFARYVDNASHKNCVSDMPANKTYNVTARLACGYGQAGCCLRGTAGLANLLASLPGTFASPQALELTLPLERVDALAARPASCGEGSCLQ